MAKTLTNIGKKTFSSITDLENVSSEILKTAQENALNRLLEDLNELIREDVYDGSTIFNGYGLEDGNDYYDQTGSLLEMFGVTKVYKRGKQIYGSIDIVNPSLDRDSDYWIHSSKVLGGNLTAKNLLDIMINGQTLENGIWEHKPHTFWEDFQKMARGKYREYFYDECKKLGLPIGHYVFGGGNARFAKTNNQYGSNSVINTTY